MACDATMINSRSIELDLNGLQWVAIALHVLTAVSANTIYLLHSAAVDEYPLQLSSRHIQYRCMERS